VGYKFISEFDSFLPRIFYICSWACPWIVDFLSFRIY